MYWATGQYQSLQFAQRNEAFDFSDIDADGSFNSEDAYPFDGAESSDRDGDGVGDNADQYPDDPAEAYDTDGDGIGNNVDDDDDGDGVLIPWMRSHLIRLSQLTLTAMVLVTMPIVIRRRWSRR